MVLGRIRTSRVLVSLLSTCLAVPVAAQTHQSVDTVRENGVRLVSPEEGEAIVLVAWELRRGMDPKPDCSHFVNAIYAQAGLDYEYARTQEIFEGIDSFRRVHRPQSGDLVVWQGHVGIVIDPEEHSFYSSVRSGFAIEDYRSDYWTSRGEARFYRYKIDEIHKARLVAHLHSQQHAVAPTQSVSTPAALPDRNLESLRSTSNPSLPNNRTPEPVASDAEISEVVFVSSHIKPSEKEIQAALVHFADLNGERLLHAARPNQLIVVPDQVVIAELSLYDHSGWVELHIKETGAIRGGQSNAKPGERWRMSLRREEGGWTLLVPQDRIYLPRNLAIRALADQVALTSRAPANDREIKRAVKALDDLLSPEIPSPHSQ